MGFRHDWERGTALRQRTISIIVWRKFDILFSSINDFNWPNIISILYFVFRIILKFKFLRYLNASCVVN